MDRFYAALAAHSGPSGVLELSPNTSRDRRICAAPTALGVFRLRTRRFRTGLPYVAASAAGIPTTSGFVVFLETDLLLKSCPDTSLQVSSFVRPSIV